MSSSKFEKQVFVTRQQGTALFVGLVFLLILSLLSISVMSSSLMQERLAGSHRNEALAAAGAESALREGERAAWNEHTLNCGTAFATGSVFNNNNNLAARTFRNNPRWATDGIVYPQLNYAGIARTPGSSRLAAQPRFLIEMLGTPDKDPQSDLKGGCEFQSMVLYYRVSARSTGSDSEVVRTLQSTLALSR